jgi:hypothetical protein
MENVVCKFLKHIHNEQKKLDEKLIQHFNTQKFTPLKSDILKQSFSLHLFLQQQASSQQFPYDS